MNYKSISIEGNIGVGKTTLAKLLSNDLGYKLILETFENNPFLKDFYENLNKNALPLELFFLAERYELLKLNSEDMFFSGTVSDFIFDKSKLFAVNTLKDYELNIFNKIFSLMKKTVKNPEILIYLHSDLSSLQNKITKRGREYENNIQSDYLKKLNDTYLDYISKRSEFPVILIDVTNIDFKNNSKHFKLIKNIIFQEHENGVTKFIPSI
ncbi:MAG: deoxynucleoside kinase [Flavobacteriales bacterium TMED84]|nr:MAG: deoxynucleoside kinase [Flavobacteriales bacterium TMED84]|tara:strand:+ start:5998 stop:6630 length:633 start_codon:yes stop_codon:yes gene_type:complete